MPDVIINLPPLPVQQLPSISAFAALRALPSAALVSGEDYVVDGSAAFGDGGGGLFVWAPSSTENDDDATIIKPSDLGPLQAGRWLLAGGDQLKGLIAGAVGAEQAALAAPGGSNLVGFLQSGTGAVARTVQSKLREEVSVEDFGAVGDGATDDTTAIQAALDYTMLVNGILNLDNKIYRVTSLHLTYSQSVPIIIQGQGPRSSVLRKLGATTTPVLTVTGTGVLDVYPEFCDFSCDGQNVASAAIKMVDSARFRMVRISAEKATVGIDCSGALIFELVKCLTNNNGTGVKTRSGATTANLISLYNHESRANTSWGLDLGGGEAIDIVSSDITANGTAANTATGGVILQNDIGAGLNVGTVRFSNSYIEANYGNGIYTGAASNLCLMVEETAIYSTEAGRAMVIGDGGKIKTCFLRNVKAPSAADVVSINAVDSIRTGGLVFTYTDTSTHIVTIGATTATTNIAMTATELQGFGSAGNELLFADDNIISGGSAANTGIFKRGAGEVYLQHAGSAKTIRALPNELGFFGTAPIGKPTGVAATAAALQTALISLGLIAP